MSVGWLTSSLNVAMKNCIGSARNARLRAANLHEPYKTYCEQIAKAYDEAARVFARHAAGAVAASHAEPGSDYVMVDVTADPFGDDDER